MFHGRENTTRLYAGAVAFMVIGLQAALTIEHPNDPWLLRLITAGYFIALVISSFFSSWVKKHLVRLFGLGVTHVGVWLSILLYLNHFHQDYSGGYNILTVAAILLFDNRRNMLVHSIVSVICLLLAGFLSEDLSAAAWAFIVVNLVMLVLGNIIVASRVNSRSKLEMELSHSLTLQEAAVESNSDAILLVDQDGNYFKGNHAFLNLWGIPAELILENRQAECEAIALTRVTDPAGLQKIWAHEEGGLPMGTPVEISFLDGRIVELYWRPMINHDELIGRLWFFRDVTARWRHEEHLLANERKLRMQNERLMEFATSFAVHGGKLEEAFREITSVSAELLQVDTVGVWFLDPSKTTMRLQVQFHRENGEFTQGANVKIADHPEFFRELFKSRVLAVSNTRAVHSTSDFFKGLYSGRASALMHAQISARGDCIGILSFECADHDRHWTMEDQNYAASLADLVAVSIATEDKKLAQEGLQNSLAVLQAIFDLSETGIIVEDSEHRILNYNELYLKMWGVTREFIDNQPYEVVIKHLLGQLKNSISYAEGLERLKERPGMEYAGILEFHDGRFIERYSKAINVGEHLMGRVWFYLDITERKRKENELINRNFELDSFVYRASHDLKAPLNSIMGLISLIREENELAAILSYVAMMDKSVKKLDEFIKQLTQFSQDVRLKVVRKPIDFQELVDDILSDLKFMDNAARLSIQTEIVQTAVFHSDPVRLGIVLANLISNAIKYQDLKKEKSLLKIQIQADNHGATCKFTDNGVGIRAEHLEKVFDLFFRASVQAAGTGLGLYITHNAVHKLGGTILVTSEPGQGTEFTLQLPSLADDDEVEASNEATSAV